MDKLYAINNGNIYQKQFELKVEHRSIRIHFLDLDITMNMTCLYTLHGNRDKSICKSSDLG